MPIAGFSPGSPRRVGSHGIAILPPATCQITVYDFNCSI